MSGVVLRCPNCGTTKPTSGECQACHEAEVRYYCTNHTPGQWLIAAVCPTCSARFGDPVPKPAPPAARRTLARPPVESPERTRGARWLPERTSGPWVRRARLPATGDTDKAPVRSGLDPRLGSWPDLLKEAASRASRMRSERRPVPDAFPVAVAFGGCLMRAVFLIIMLLVAFVVFSFLAGGFMLQGF